MRNHKKALLLAAALGMVTVMGCMNGAANTHDSGFSGLGGSGGVNGTSGNGGSGGSGVSMGVDPGKPGTAFVSAGHVVSNADHKLVFTLGQSSGVQTNLSSTGYRLHGGLIGATQGK